MQPIAVITGGSRGIGLACARALAHSGWSVILLCHTGINNAELACHSLRSQGFNASWKACDLRNPEAVKMCFEELYRFYHHIDALVLSAGIAMIRMFTDTNENDWNELIQVNLMGTVRCIRAVLPDMVSRKNGSIVTISSMWGEVGASCESAYSVTKAGIIGLTKSLAKELGPSGIRVNCVSPGVIQTEMNQQLTPETLNSLIEETPVGRIGKPEDVADMVAFLCSEQASFITGQVIGINGGMII